MVGVTGSIKQSDIEKILNPLNELAKGDFKKPLLKVGVYLVRSTANNFKKQCEPDGKAWSENFRQKQWSREGRKGKKPRILEMSGRMRNSVTSNVTQNVTETTLEFGTNVEYAKLQQFGGPSEIVTLIKRKKKILKGKNKGKFRTLKKEIGTYSRRKIIVPPRPFIGISSVDKTVIEFIFKDYYRVLGYKNA